MVTKAPSTVRASRLRERRSRGVVLVAPVEVGEGGVALLVSNGLLKENETRDRKAFGEAIRFSEKVMEYIAAANRSIANGTRCELFIFIITNDLPLRHYERDAEFYTDCRTERKSGSRGQ